MDTSHIAEHAGTAGALFASIFVVATTTLRTMIPLRIFGILANVVLFLCSDLAGNVTGAQYVVDGGRTATGGSVTAMPKS